MTFLPSGVSVEGIAGESLIDAAQRAGVYIAADCRGNGSCGSCRVRLTAGAVSPVTEEESALLSAEELSHGVRLACRCIPCGECTVALEGTSEGTEKGNLRFPADFSADAYIGGGRYALAFDVGTTTVAGMLLDTQTGRVAGTASRANPQGAHGADVISRIEYCMNEAAGLETLKSEIMTCLDSIALELADAAGLIRRNISRAMAVGNTTMTHLLFGVDPRSLARAPFTPVFLEHAPIDANEAGLHIAPGAKLEALPNIASHVGADITGAILASRMCSDTQATMLIDVGTNGEMAFMALGRLAVCSTAAGPAFEGASVERGMRAAPGAITGAYLTQEGDLAVTVYGGAAARGICGSGLIDAVAVLADAGVIDRTGKLLSSEKAEAKGASSALTSRIRTGERGYAFALAQDDAGEDILLTQKDVREIQLAKAAIAAGRKLVLRELGIEESTLSRVMLAGAFGSHIRPKSAMRLGLIPKTDEGAVIQLGNAAGAGACMASLSAKEHERAREEAMQAEHIDLASHPDFQTEFIDAMRF